MSATESPVCWDHATASYRPVPAEAAVVPVPTERVVPVPEKRPDRGRPPGKRMSTPEKAKLMATLIACQRDLRDLGSDWESGIPGPVRFRILRNANKMLRATRDAEPLRLRPTRRSWLILHDLADPPA